jgi:hypothetical protein
MAYDFNGTTQYLQVGSAVLTAAPLTMACWFKAEAATGAYQLVTVSNAGTAGAATRFTLIAAGQVAGDPVRVVTTNTSNVSGVADTTSGFSTNTWHHACGVFESASSRTAYIDAGSSGTNTTSVTPTLLNRTNIGVIFLQSVGGTSGTGFMDGQIAEVGIWNVALTTAEIASLADGMTCDKVRPQSLVFYAPLVRDLIDYKGGLTITNNNTATVANHPRVYA